MAEVAAAPVVPETAAMGAPAAVAGVGGGMGRGRGKGKAKKKGKAKAKARPVELDENGQPIPKPKAKAKIGLRQQVEEEIGDRDIEEVIKEARAKVDELQAAVEKAQMEEVKFESTILEGKTKMEAASMSVDTCVQKETLALEKFKAAKQALIEAQVKVAEKKLAAGDESKALEILQTEGESQKKEADLLEAKRVAAAAKEAARRAYEEAKAEERRVAEEIKNKKLMICDDPEVLKKMQEDMAKEAAAAEEERQARKEAKGAGKGAQKELKDELRQMAAESKLRDKERATAFKEASGLGGKKRLALADGVAASPAKAAKTVIQDVD